jgi:RHS repeat-associated protein
VLDLNAGETQSTYTNGPGIDNKLGQVRDGEHGYYFQDHLGNTVGLTDPSGYDPTTTSYDAYGRPSSGIQTRFTYTGREPDSDTGLMYYRARWYDPTLGRFISEDPIGFAGGKNWYQYAHNNPVAHSDPSGMRDDPGDGYWPGYKAPGKDPIYDISPSGNPVIVHVWQSTFPDFLSPLGFFGHVSYDIDGYTWSWDQNGYGSGPRRTSDYLADNFRYRGAHTYTVDLGPEGNRQFARSIVQAYNGKHPPISWNRYNLFTNNCGSA